MKILYAIQGTGNGHITVAREAIPILQSMGEVDILISGTEVDVELPWPVKYRLHGLCFVFGKRGGIDYVETFRKANVKRLFADIQSLPVEEYDLVLSDFEPVSAWACYIKGKVCVGFSHQAAVVNKRTPQARKKDIIGRAVLKYYAPVSHRFGFHFLPYDRNIFTPIIRREIRTLHNTNDGHFTVYLPAFSDKKIIRLLQYFPEIKWEVFSKHSKLGYTIDNIHIHPVQHEKFIQSIASSAGVLCGAGFQTPAEVLYLRKKLMVVPMKGQYEQQCNGAALELMGIPVIKNLKTKQVPKLREWMKTELTAHLDFPDDTAMILEDIIDQFAGMPARKNKEEKLRSAGKLRDILLKKIFSQQTS